MKPVLIVTEITRTVYNSSRYR